MGFHATRDNRWAVKVSDISVISVKPYQFLQLAKEIMDVVKDKIMVSVMAGIPLRILKQVFPEAEVYRAMPNLNAVVGMSATALVIPPDARNKDMVIELFKCVGQVYEIPEQLMYAWTAIVGSGPAIIAELIDAMILAALAVGIPRDIAYNAILETLVGTAEYLRIHPKHPVILRDEVTTPGGTTIKALKVIEAKGIKSTIIDAVEKAAKRSRELAKEIENLIENNYL